MTTSWVIRDKSTKAVIAETFNPRLVDRLNTAKYEAVPIMDYLIEFNLVVKRKAELETQLGLCMAFIGRQSPEKRYREIQSMVNKSND